LAQGEPRKIVCKVCGKEIPDARNCPDLNCQAPLKPVKKTLQQRSLGDRQKLGEKPFERKTETLAKFGSRIAMVLSCSCDIDQQGEIVFLGVRPLSSLGKSMQDKLAAGQPINNLKYLPPTTRMEAAAIEMNIYFSLPRTWFGQPTTYPSPKKNGALENALIPFAEVVGQRLASLDVSGIQDLYRAQIQHITRSPGAAITFPPGFALEEIERERPNPNPLPKRGWTLPNPAGVVRPEPILLH
jgi:hypothetical protein